MKFETDKPCKSCPYRRDVPVETWHRAEFEKLLTNDSNEHGGSLYGCHKFRNRREEASICAGWFLDQKRRGFPALMLRLYLMRNQITKEQIDAVTDGGMQLYSSIRVMCAANGIPIRGLTADERDELAEIEVPVARLRKKKSPKRA